MCPFRVLPGRSAYPMTDLRGPALFSILAIFLLLSSGCLNDPTQQNSSTSSQATGKVRKVLKSGEPVTDLATGLDGPASLVLDSGGTLFFAESNAGMIKSYPTAGGSVTTEASALTNPYDLVLDEGTSFEVLYVAGYDPGGGKIQKVCIICTGAQRGDVDLLAQNQPGSIALVEDPINSTNAQRYIYYTNREGQQVMKVSNDICTSGNPPTDNPCVSPAPLAQAPGVTGPHEIVLVGGHLYFTDGGSSGALRCVLADGTDPTVTTIVSGLNQPGPLETDGTNLYFSEVGAPGTNTGTIKKVAATCQAATPSQVADSLSEPRGIAIDTNGDVYYTEWVAGRIGKVAGGIQTTLVSGLNHPFRLILDTQFIYFTETDTVF